MKKKKRVLFYASGIDEGGVARALTQFINLCEKEGYEVGVIVPYESDIEKVAIPHKYVVGYYRKRPLGSRVVLRIINLFNLITGYRFFFAFKRRIPHDIFIVYQGKYQFQWALYSMKPKAVWFHGAPKDNPNHASIRFVGNLRRIIARGLYRQFATMAAVSDEAAQSYSELFHMDLPEVIPNLMPVDDIVLRGYQSSISKTPSVVKKLVFVGRISREKGLDRLINVLGRLSDEGFDNWSLCVVGDGPDRRCCTQLAKQLGILNRIQFEGMRACPYLYMRAADLLVLPSQREGFGLVLWESLLCRTPVLSTDCGGPASALRGGSWGKIVPNTDQSLYEGLREYLSGADYNPICSFDEIEEEIRRCNRESIMRHKNLLKALGGLL